MGELRGAWDLLTLSKEFVHLPCKQSFACGLQERRLGVQLTVD